MSAGIAFVVLLVVGEITTFNSSPDIHKHESDASVAAKYVSTLANGHDRAGLIAGAYLLVLAALAFVWFTQGLGTQVSSEAAGRLVGALGVLGAAALAAAGMASAVLAGAISFGKEPVPADGDTARAVMEMSIPLVIVAFALTAAAVIAIVALRGTGLPGWLGASAWLGVIGGVFGVLFWPLLVALLWFLIAGVVGVRPTAPADA